MINAMIPPMVFQSAIAMWFFLLAFLIPGTKLPKNVFYRQEKALEALNEFLWTKVVGCFQYGSVQQALSRVVLGPG